MESLAFHSVPDTKLVLNESDLFNLTKLPNMAVLTWHGPPWPSVELNKCM